MTNSKASKTKFRKTFLKILSLTLAVLMLLPLFAACSTDTPNLDDGADDSKDPAGNEATITDEEAICQCVRNFITAYNEGDMDTALTYLSAKNRNAMEAILKLLGGVAGAYMGIDIDLKDIFAIGVSTVSGDLMQLEITSVSITSDAGAKSATVTTSINLAGTGAQTVYFHMVYEHNGWYIGDMRDTAGTSGNGGASGEEENITTTKIIDATPFNNGVAYVTAEKTTTDSDGNLIDCSYILALIDTNGKILHRYDGLFDPLFGQSFFCDVIYKDNVVYNKKLEIVISPETHGYDSIIAVDTENGLFLVAKTEESFSGDKISIGLLNNKGEYVSNISQEHLIASEMNKNNMTLSYVSFEYICDDIIEIIGFRGDTVYYHLLTGEVALGYEHYIYGTYSELIKVDENNEETYILDHPNYVCQMFEDVLLVETWGEDEDSEENTYALFDYAGNKIFDFGDNKIVGQMWENSAELPYYYLGGYLLTLVENPTGAKYCCLFNSQGELAFDPIRYEEGDHFYALTNRGFVLKQGDSYFFVDYNGNKTQYNDTIYYAVTSNFCEGLALVGTSNGYVFIDYSGETVISADMIFDQITE